MTRPPIAIIAWCVIWVVVAINLVHQGVVAAGGPGGMRLSDWLPVGLGFGLQLLMTVMLWRMSKIAVVLSLIGSIVTLVSGFFAEETWRERYPLLGPFVPVVLGGVFAGTVLPHWKKMSWRPFGRGAQTSKEPIENAFS